MITAKTIFNISIPIYCLAATLNIIAYYSVAPILLFGIYVGLILLIMKFIAPSGPQERAGVLLICAITWFWAGVSAIFIEHVSIDSQGSDVWYFYDVVTDKDFIPIQQNAIVQNAAPIFIWKIAYEYSEKIGFTQGIYVGVTLNIFFMAITALIGMKMVKIIFPNDPRRLSRFIILYAGCGMFWLFGSIHLRDSMILFMITLLLLFWVRYLGKRSPGNLINLVIATVVGSLILGAFRTDFRFVPGALLLAALTAKLIGEKRKRSINILLVGCSVIGAVLSAHLFIDDLVGAFENAKRYQELSIVEGGSNSLGNNLIINQPLLIRTILSGGYLLLSPIPFWSGLFTESIYHAYKSFNVLFMYFLIPLLGLSLKRLVENKLLRTTPILFIAFTSIGFIFAVGYSSLEGRHLGAFYVPVMILGLLPDLDKDVDRIEYKSYLSIFLLLIFILHLFWMILKMI